MHNESGTITAILYYIIWLATQCTDGALTKVCTFEWLLKHYENKIKEITAVNIIVSCKIYLKKKLSV